MPRRLAGHPARWVTGVRTVAIGPLHDYANRVAVHRGHARLVVDRQERTSRSVSMYTRCSRRHI